MNARGIKLIRICGVVIFVLFVCIACGGSQGPNRTPSSTPEPGPDITPDVFSFADISGAENGELFESDTVSVLGIESGESIPLTIEGGEYSIDSGPYSAEETSVVLGQSVRVRLMTGGNPNTTYSALLSLGDVQDAFDVTTVGGVPLRRGSENWRSFNGNYQNSRHSVDALISAENVSTLAVVSRVSAAGVSGTPVFVDDTLYYADYAGWLHAVDAETGRNIWSERLQNAMFTGSVFVDGHSIYVAGDGSTVYSVNKVNGQVNWSTDIEDTPYDRIWSSPVVVGNTLLIGAASFQVFRPIDDPEELFRGGIVALNATTGEFLWRLSVCPEVLCGGGVSVWSSVAIDTELGLGYIGTGQAYNEPAGPYSDSLIAFDYVTGEMAWHYQFTPGDVYTVNGGSLDHDIGASPNLFEAEVEGVTRALVGVGDKGGRYMVFDRASGERIWQTDVGLASPIGGVMGTAAFADGKIFLTSNTSVVGTSRFDPVPATGIAYALDASTGEVVWETVMGAGSFSGNTVSNGLMYFVTWDGQLRVLSADDGHVVHAVDIGEERGSFDQDVGGFPNGSSSGPSIANGRIYVGYGWTWTAETTGGIAILRTEAQPAPLKWSAECPEGFTVNEGLNTGFDHEARERSFYALEAAEGEGPRPVFVALTGTAELEASFMRASFIQTLPSIGVHVVAPVRVCATAGSNAQCASGSVSTMDGRTWEPWFDGVLETNTEQYMDEGTDVRYIEAVVKCAATRFNIDQSQVYVGGISAGGTLTNRALTFNSEFFAGGAPASGEWYRTDGAGITEEDVGGLIVEGRVAPRPINLESDALDSSINIVLWGGPTDKWYRNGATGDLIANYNPSTKLAANYYESQENVVTVACTHDLDYQAPIGGHVWPRSESITHWVLQTLTSHPKATPPELFRLPETPAGLSCRLGSYQDH